MSTSITPISEALLNLQVVTPGEDFAANDRVLRAITARLSDMNAVSATFNDAEDRLTIEMTPLLVAIARNQMYLIRELARHRGVTEEAVRFDAREFLATIRDR